MDASCSVRRATHQDVETIVALWGEHVDFHADCDPRFSRKENSEDGFAQHIRGKLDEVDYLLLVAEIDGVVVGFLNGQVLQYPPCFSRREHGYIDNLAVSLQWQRRGIGTALLKQTMLWFAEKGVPDVEGRVLLSNPIAMSFWQKTQFQPYMEIIRASTTPLD